MLSLSASLRGWALGLGPAANVWELLKASKRMAAEGCSDSTRAVRSIAEHLGCSFSSVHGMPDIPTSGLGPLPPPQHATCSLCCDGCLLS